MGDFNVKVGANSHINWPSEVGKFDLGIGNERGERLLQFCAINGLTVVNTLYKHKKMSVVTWISPDCVTKNEIDYCLVQRDSLKLVKKLLCIQFCRYWFKSLLAYDKAICFLKAKSYKNKI